jgi:hypothetical protein
VRAERETLLGKFAAAVTVLDRHFASDPDRLEDRNADAEMRGWLDGDEQPLRWAGVESTADEWFFITTLYGQEKRPQQRRRIRRYYPLFIDLTRGQIKNLIPSMIRDWTLRADWMKKRLCNMAEILRERGLAMAEYVDHLKQVEKNATPRNPMPALDTIVRDLRATSSKTLSVFVRDCVGGNCFPIDSRVEKELLLLGLPANERLLVSLSLAVNRNPRQVARMFYEAGGEGGNFAIENFSHRHQLMESSLPAGSETVPIARNHGRGVLETAIEPRQGNTLMTRELDSLAGLKSGYVLNLFGGPTGRIGNVVHPHDCFHLKRMTIPPRKIWAATVAELKQWVNDQGGELDPRTPTCSQVST